MIVEQIAHIIAEYVIFLELTGEDELDPDTAMKVLEGMGSQLAELEPAFLRQLVDAFSVICEQYSGEMQKVVRDIPYHFELEEKLAEGDPVRLAELDALREAREANE